MDLRKNKLSLKQSVPSIYFNRRTRYGENYCDQRNRQSFAELNGLELDPSKYTQEIFPILLAAPTGRAAKRMNETTGLPASTIHRLLGLNGREKHLQSVRKN